MLSAIVFATSLMAAAPAEAAEPTPGPDRLPIRGITVDRNRMPEGVTHIEAPPLRSFKIQSVPAPAPSVSPSPKPRR